MMGNLFHNQTLGKLNMEQGSTEWHKWRRGGLGSSDAPVLMGEYIYSTPFKLWETKTGRKDHDQENWGTRMGHELEPKARNWYELMNDCEMPPILVQHPTIDFLRASLDGGSFEMKHFIEIKFVGDKEFDRLTVVREIPQHHMFQVQHQFMVTGFESCDYVAFNQEKRGLSIPILPNFHMMKKMQEVETNWWKTYVVKDIPPPLVDKDSLDVSDDVEWNEKMVQLAGAKRRLKASQDNFAMHRDEFLKELPHARIVAAGIEVCKTKRGLRVREINNPTAINNE